MGFLSVLGYAQQVVKERVQPGERVIDATMGTGVDTLFLARLTGSRGSVAAFDVQEEALELTRKRLHRELGEDEYAHVSLLQASHHAMNEVLGEEWSGTTAAIMFNLGYLPTNEADKRIMTVPETTLTALDNGLSMLRPGGVLSIVLYPGHSGGDDEADQVRAWAESLPARLGQAVIYRMLQRPDAPYVIAVEKRK
ncbi:MULTISPECIES: class I SAM-dependent methyltransferase [Paenibacillus]|uniref:SAM-dependent methyltransferase n=1 Tax=Paenibacillus popilliae TaxID=78057 RepID=A0ABY3APT8_PAEPP|nr:MULTISPECIES: class I SAM-dependent methyltransferase [Paenibacillus]TQR44814.1 SAM-dependent methyltransferase [Paenibacillus sp. SDF0028]